MSSLVKAHAALVVVNVIYGASYVVAKEVTPLYIQPFGLILIRVSMASLLYLLFYLWVWQFSPGHSRFRNGIQKQDVGRLVLCGLFGVAVNQLLFFKGLSMTSPISASLIMITTPILVLLIATFLLQEHLGRLKILGVVLGALGAAAVIAGGKSGYHSGSTAGNVLVFINAASYGLYLVIVKPLMQRYHPLTVILWVFLTGLCFVLPVGYTELAAVQWHTITPFIWLCIVFLVTATTFLTYLLNIYALGKVSPSVVGIYIYSQPLIATLIAVGLGKDSLSPLKAGAAILIFAGVYLVSNTPGKKNAATNTPT
ncbi:EamA/RhaT family transporter [Sphingobacteriales bacterium UPWRP_1]|nr:hypothetical protein B6N25_11885 [Sphingobacteriales bacterium TSM_CSS]PSJ77222.1 EamA/RhaT family transporter [Sphingobacteriales bacterium UPWRP_1]